MSDNQKDIKQALRNNRLEDAHKHSLYNREELLQSEVCGCFGCMRIFSPEKIKEWVDKDENNVGETALCPFCGMDSVMGDKSEFPMVKGFLKKMYEYWLVENQENRLGKQ